MGCEAGGIAHQIFHFQPLQQRLMLPEDCVQPSNCIPQGVHAVLPKFSCGMHAKRAHERSQLRWAGIQVDVQRLGAGAVAVKGLPAVCKGRQQSV